MFNLTLDDFKKVKSIKVTDYLKIIKPTYTYLKITPDTSIRNYNSATIAKTIQTLHRTVTNRIHKEAKVWTYECPAKVSFYIYIEKNDVEFYFIVPSRYEQLMKEKISAVWGRATIEVVQDIPRFDNSCLKHQLVYAKEDALSLSLDKKCNEPLNSIFNVLDIMQEGDKVGIFYNFIPAGQRGWRKEHDRTIKRIRENYPVDREKFNPGYMLKVTINFILDMMNELADAITEFLGGKTKHKTTLTEVAVTSLMLDDKKKLTTSTVNKKEATILNTQIVVMSESDNLSNTRNNAMAVMNSFNTISNDNELIYKKVKTNFNPTDFILRNIEINKMSTDECQNFLELPGRDLLQKYSNVKKVDVLESEVPEQLQSGVIRAGESIFKGKPSKVYHTEDKELKNTAICICGPNRSGKSTLFANMVHDIIKDGRTVILPDFCGKCQLSGELAAVIPKEKITNIICNDYNTLQGFGFNEIVPKDDSIFELYNCAKMKAAKLKELINLVNNGDNDLEGRMERYLEYAALVVFVCNGSVNDVFKVLKNHIFRHKYVNSIPAELRETMNEYVEELLEIDEWSRETKDTPAEVIGTKQGHISAILSRVNRLKENAYIEMMLKKDCANNINLIEEMQKGKLICIKMYDSMFITQQQKDIYVSYWVTKIWGALQKRFCDSPEEELRQVVILIDELYQTKNCERYLTMILSQMPKYRAKLVLSCHHLGQIPVIQEELKSAMCSYMFIAGSNKKNFMAMKEEFEDKGYSLEDLLHLKRYHALNLLAYEEGYWAGITLLPPPIN